MEPGDYSIRGGIIDIFPPGLQSQSVWIFLAIRLTAFANLTPQRSAQ